jgi:hypothetical protein
MAAKERSLALLVAAIALVAAPAAFASIPRSEILQPPSIDFRHLEVVDVDASIDNEELLARTLDRSFPASAPVDTLSESRVWVCRLERPLIVRPTPPLSHALRRGSVAAWPEVASEPTVLTPDPLGYQDSSNLYAFAGGDPVNGRDPTGEQTAGDASRQIQAQVRLKAMTVMMPSNDALAFMSIPGRYAMGELAAGFTSQLEFGEHFVEAYEAARRGDYARAVSETTVDVLNGLAVYGTIKTLGSAVSRFTPSRFFSPVRQAVTEEGLLVSVPEENIPNGTLLSEGDRKKMNVGGSGHHVPAVRKARGRPFEVDRVDKTRPTMHVVESDPAEAHWRLHDAERQHVGPRQGDFVGTDKELFDAYRRAYAGLDDIKVDVRSPNGQHILATGVTPRQAVDVIETWLASKGLL